MIESMQSLGIDKFRMAFTRFPAFYSDNPYTMICRRVCKCEPLLRFNPLNLKKKKSYVSLIGSKGLSVFPQIF